MVWCVAAKEATHHERLHAGSAPAVLSGANSPGAERALDDTYHALRGNIAWQDQELLLRAQDLEIELREETSLASFIAGFRLGMGIAREIEPYSFEDEEERRATEKAKAWHPQSKN